ncbi:sugar transferase, PEP-CTERM system associated/exopolysaccharide biosynthesis polyprenyl glycosylphosphotransferase [Dyella sp. OK004]|uniref:TIGR03013 family XrtA/PEP-CTERM system glycosyltransferase n=1 Tax=Dyella sp. OK004 TaxID=1855292 RepID=UPI0008E340C1|nr:TIGR03013 family XrtA/PEP-CTERM system glycosyltransferase [Dyella sp. OK004]SFS17061.1 sugar transferase, PEP-CTERM system associated/exopolysaccharide biosynthesis polyprenyl glycosylphosphotransferase [Dyella sp. OK004]
MLHFLRRQAARWLLLLGGCELLLLAASLNLAMQLRYFRSTDELTEFSAHMPERSLVFALIIVLAMVALGQYQAHMRMTRFGLLAHQAVAFVLGGLGLVVAYYVVPQAYVGRGVLGIALVLGFIAVTTFRLLFMRLVELDALKRRVLILGAGMRAAQFHNLMRRRSDRRGFNVVGYLPRQGEPIVVENERVLSAEAPLSQLVQREAIDEVVVGVDDRRGHLPMDDLLECRQLGITITDLTTFFERESGRVQLTLLEPSWLVFSGGFNATPLRRLSKRCFDLTMAVVLMLLCWPLMLLEALAIRLESGAGQPILYRQERVGERGKTFSLLKFRSMRTDAERDGVVRWACKNDDRVTRVGRISRKLRIDELPQLWNVFKGDMSIVGPRPERPQLVADLTDKIRYYSVRHCLKPGLAGWAQISYPYGASVEEAAEKLKYDLFYVKNHNLLFDLLILIQTVEVVLFGRGAR